MTVHAVPSCIKRREETLRESTTFWTRMTATFAHSFSLLRIIKGRVSWGYSYTTRIPAPSRIDRWIYHLQLYDLSLLLATRSLSRQDRYRRAARVYRQFCAIVGRVGNDPASGGKFFSPGKFSLVLKLCAKPQKANISLNSLGKH
jgi:hypothetical protein